MKNKITLTFEDYEKTSEPQEDYLVGGFSKSFSNQKEIAFAEHTNNCDGGNCVSGCGGNGNYSCNTATGCSVQ